MTESRFDWFARWVDQYVCVTLTFANRRSWEEMGTCFKGTDARLGSVGHWTFAVESLSVRGGHSATLRRLSEQDGEAFSLCYTDMVDTFNYANDGRHVSGFDLTVPQIRYGDEPERFSAELERAGFLDARIPTRGMGAIFVEEAFGITLDRELLERPMPVVTGM
jgi:hypothetical protein